MAPYQKSVSAFARGLFAAATLLAASSIANAQPVIDLIQNRWSPSQYLQVTTTPPLGGAVINEPLAGTMPTGAPAAQWAIEPAADANLIRLRSVSTDLYLHAEGGKLQVGPMSAPDMPSASWSPEHVPGNPDARIRNSATGDYLHTKDGPLVLGAASPEWQQSYWTFVPVTASSSRIIAWPQDDTLIPSAVPTPSAADGYRIAGSRWLWIKGQYICANGCTPGFHVIGKLQRGGLGSPRRVATVIQPRCGTRPAGSTSNSVASRMAASGPGGE